MTKLPSKNNIKQGNLDFQNLHYNKAKRLKKIPIWQVRGYMLKLMEWILLALIKPSLFYGQMLMSGSFPVSLLNHDINTSR